MHILQEVNITILIVTQDYDPTVDPIAEKLHEGNHRFVRFDLSDFPLNMTITHDEFLGDSTIDVRDRTVNLNELQSVWYRRPTDFEFGDDLKPHEKKFAILESSMGVGGLLRATKCLWINRPDYESVAALKPYQLHLAKSLGLETPTTLITNDPERVRQVLETGVDLIYKLISPGLIHEDRQMPVIVLTTDMAKVPSDLIDRVRIAPCLFQELVPKDVEVRLTVIGRSYFPVVIQSQEDSATTLDWRGAEEMNYGPFLPIPSKVLEATKNLMENLNLIYGAIDFIVRPDGEWVFLEINPMGQFMWMEEDLNLPMSTAMANLLVGGTEYLNRPIEVVPYEL